MRFWGMGSGYYCMAQQQPACADLDQLSCATRLDCSLSGSACSFRFGGGCYQFGLHRDPSGPPVSTGGKVAYGEAWLFLHEALGHGIERILAANAGRLVYGVHPDWVLTNTAYGHVVDGAYRGPRSSASGPIRVGLAERCAPFPTRTSRASPAS